MSLPNGKIKIQKDGILYTSNIDACEYTIQELTRAALRDIGKMLCKRFREAYYQSFRKNTGKGGKACQYFVKSKVKPMELQVGIKGGQSEGFYARFQETGTSKQPRLGLIHKVTHDNLAEIGKIEKFYLSGINDEAFIDEFFSGSDIDENDDYWGNADT